MKDNEEWQSKNPDFIPTDDTGIRPLDYDKRKLKKHLRPYDKASVEKMVKWIDSI